MNSLVKILILIAAISSSIAHAELILSSDKLKITDLGVGVKPSAINSNGVVVGQTSNGQAFRWDQGNLTNLGTLGGSQSFANDINDSGTIVGWSFDAAGKQKSFKWDGALTNLDSTITFEGAAEAINSSGEIVGWRTNGTIFGSTRWDNANTEGEFLFSDSGLSQKALGINNQGEIVGITLATNTSAEQGYYWNGSDDIGNFTSRLGEGYLPIAGISNASVTAGAGSNQEAHYLPIGGGGARGIGKLLSSDSASSALGLNDIGLIVGESGAKGFIYDITTQTLYNSNDFPFLNHDFDSILRINDINNDGTFVGLAQLNGVEHGVTGTFVTPEPSSLALMATAGVVIWLIASRSKAAAGCALAFDRDHGNGNLLYRATSEESVAAEK